MKFFVMSFGDEENSIPEAKPVDESDRAAVQKLLASLEDDPDSRITAKWQRKGKLNAAEQEENRTRRRVNRNYREEEKAAQEYADSLLRFEMELATIKAGEHSALDLVRAAAEVSTLSRERIIEALHSMVHTPFGKQKLSYGQIKGWLAHLPRKQASSPEATGAFPDSDLEVFKRMVEIQSRQAQVAESYQQALFQIRFILASFNQKPSATTLATIASIVANTPMINMDDLKVLGFNIFLEQNLAFCMEQIEKKEGPNGIIGCIQALVTIYHFTHLEILADILKAMSDDDGNINAQKAVTRLKEYFSMDETPLS